MKLRQTCFLKFAQGKMLFAKAGTVLVVLFAALAGFAQTGADDRAFSEAMTTAVGDVHCVSAAGRLSFPGTAALIRDARLLISNDSAPVHLASAMQTPVIEIYGATVPEFGFTPFGVPHRIVQREGLSCRPCGIHGGNVCPIGTFECMKSITPRDVLAAAEELLGQALM